MNIRDTLNSLRIGSMASAVATVNEAGRYVLTEKGLEWDSARVAAPSTWISGDGAGRGPKAGRRNDDQAPRRLDRSRSIRRRPLPHRPVPAGAGLLPRRLSPDKGRDD